MQRLIYGLSIWVVACATIAMPQVSGAMRDKNERTVMVGGAAMFPSKDIIDNAVNSKDHTTLVAAVKAAGLVTRSRARTVHGVRADQRGVRQAAGGYRRRYSSRRTRRPHEILTYHVVPAGSTRSC